MTSNDSKHIDKTVTDHQENEVQRNKPSSDIIIKAINYPSGYPENKQKERCHTKDEKHKNCHPMHCHHMQPMQSATTTPFINETSNHVQKISQHDSKK